MRLGWGGNRRVLEYICAGLLFSLIIGITVFGRPLESLDELWQYSFGSNIRKGCLPYRDINMVTAPFSQFVGAGALWVFGDCLLVYRGLGTVLGTLCMLLFYDILRISGAERRLAWCLSLYVCVFYSACFTYDYNYLVLFFLLAVMDSMLRPLGRHSFVIGCLAGCAVMTKQSTGLILFLAVTFLGILLWEGSGRRKWILYGAGVLLPVGSCCIWMAGQGIWADFLEYAFGGLKGFAEQNRITAGDFFFRSGILCTLEGILWMIILAAELRKLVLCAGIYPLPGEAGRKKIFSGNVRRKEKRLSLEGNQEGKRQSALEGNQESEKQAVLRDRQEQRKTAAAGDSRELHRRMIMTGLSLAGMAVVYPITDETHFIIALFPFLIMGICELSVEKMKKEIVPMAVPIGTAAACLLISAWQIRGDEAYSGLKHLEGVRLDRDTAAQIETVNAYLAAYAADRPIYILDGAAVLYKIPMDLYDKDYDICNTGNWGSQTVEEVAERLLEMDGVMLLAAEGYSVNWQVPERFLEYIRERAVCIDHVGKYDVYLADDGEHAP